jgi:hypothetical protein
MASPTGAPIAPDRPSSTVTAPNPVMVTSSRRAGRNRAASRLMGSRASTPPTDRAAFNSPIARLSAPSPPPSPAKTSAASSTMATTR